MTVHNSDMYGKEVSHGKEGNQRALYSTRMLSVTIERPFECVTPSGLHRTESDSLAGETRSE